MAYRSPWDFDYVKMWKTHFITYFIVLYVKRSYFVEECVILCSITFIMIMTRMRWSPSTIYHVFIATQRNIIS